MLKSALKTLVGSHHKREAKKLQPLVDEIKRTFEGLAALSDEELKAKTGEFRSYIEDQTSEVRGQIEGLREAKRHSEDSDERERLSLEIG